MAAATGLPETASDSGELGEPEWVQLGFYGAHEFGYSVATIGDFNGDGFDDVVVGGTGDPNNDAGGAVAVILGSASGLEVSETSVGVYLFLRGGNNRRIGSAVTGAGDFDGDGYADFAYAGSQTVSLVLGSAFFFSGFDNLTLEGYVVDPSLDGGGDVDADGFDDLLLARRNSVYLFAGNPAGTLGTPSWQLDGLQFFDRGQSVAMLGDVNGDGHADFAVGESRFELDAEREGVVRVFHGSSTEPTPAAVLEAPIGSLWFGKKVAGVGDVNGDGYADLAVQDLYDEVRVFHGSSLGVGTTPDWSSGSGVSEDVDAAGDVNGDGFDDVVTGNLLSDEVHLFLGSPSGLAPEAAWVSHQPGGGNYGRDVGTAGDVNGDGRADFLYSEPNLDTENPSQVSIGRVFLQHGVRGACPSGGSTDVDADTIPCSQDNCPSIANVDQVDLDGDGSGAACDCDDDDPTRFVGAFEACDGFDSDCSAANASLETDDDGDGYVECGEWVGDPTILGGGDCDDRDPATWAGATEINDGQDNQCPGDAGFGEADEVSGLVATTANRFEWSPQPGATAYEFVSSTDVRFETGCSTQTIEPAFIDDDTVPSPAQTLYLLVRPGEPFAGGWGRRSNGWPRAVTCE